ncbi:ABC transporter permease [Rhabdothermincola salaria]|uniref:ABC transporter permease subunit n=1 Tax=Rhabdothermincola salaria TaxID=2903142 RepID=UPI001E3AFC93|nr:ABC transporter permease [Rhabdothermincola salaria]MCD9622624.1 ABC transporter permease [Rhabdothermincola salaria]
MTASASASAAPTRTRRRINTARMFTVMRTDLRQLVESKDFWVPMLLLGGFFFLIVPAFLLSIITSIGNVSAIQQVSQALELLPQSAQQAVPQDVDPSTQVGYVLAVYLFAPIAVVVPLTISTAVGAATIVGERERGTGEFLAHSPADVREIYMGKLIASLIPGYVTTIVGFGIYSVMVNLLVGRKVGGWFFPTTSWWLLILWVLPPFLAIALSLVLRLSARVKSTAAAQQASGLVTFPLILIAYGQSTGALLGSGTPLLALVIGAVAWVIALLSLATGFRSLTRARLLGVANEQ